MSADIPVIFSWYIALFFLGVVFIPLTRKLFPWFIDQGYPFSKIVGVLMCGYSVWLLGSLSILPFSRGTIGLAILGWTIVNIYIHYRTPKEEHGSRTGFWKLFSPTSQPLRVKLLIAEEILFILALLFWAYIRGHEPSIRGLEKFMDFGFINAIVNTSYFPPQDMWLAPAADPRYTQGFSINYYYFGHYITAFLTKLTDIPSFITYNLMLSSLFAWTFTQSFSIGLNLIKRGLTPVKRALADTTLTLRDILSGLLTAFLVTLAGNLHTIYVFTKGYPNEEPIPFWQILQLNDNSNYWYPNATRFIPNTIHEFPSYSWVVADLHGHVLDIPFVLLMLGVLLSISAGVHLWKTKTLPDQKRSGILDVEFTAGWFERFQENLLSPHIAHAGIRLVFLMFLGLLCAVMYMTNAWDGLIYLALSTATLAVLTIKIEALYLQTFTLKSVIINTLVQTGIVFASFLLFSLPFNVNFSPFVSGLGVVGGWEMLNALGMKNLPDVYKAGPLLFEKGNNLRSPMWMLGVLWGFFYFNASFFMYHVIVTIHAQNHSILESFRPWLPSPNRIQTIHQKFMSWIHTVVELITTRIQTVDLYIILLICISTGLLIFPEFFYAKDIYPGHYRANTMFKLGYQAYIMLSLVSGYALVLIRMHVSKKRQSFSISRMLLSFSSYALFVLVAIYPYFAIESYYGVIKTRSYEGQDGIAWLKTFRQGDYDAIAWFNGQPTPEGSSVLGTSDPSQDTQHPVILEAVGDSYTDYARISAYTGLPTPLGWPVHQWLWRGSYDEPGRRVEEVKQIYEGTEKEAVEALLNTYAVQYIVIGDMERQKYPNINEPLLNSFGTVVFTSGTTSVIERIQHE